MGEGGSDSVLGSTRQPIQRNGLGCWLVAAHRRTDRLVWGNLLVESLIICSALRLCKEGRRADKGTAERYSIVDRTLPWSPSSTAPRPGLVTSFVSPGGRLWTTDGSHQLGRSVPIFHI